MFLIKTNVGHRRVLLLVCILCFLSIQFSNFQLLSTTIKRKLYLLMGFKYSKFKFSTCEWCLFCYLEFLKCFNASMGVDCRTHRATATPPIHILFFKESMAIGYLSFARRLRLLKGPYQSNCLIDQNKFIWTIIHFMEKGFDTLSLNNRHKSTQPHAVFPS